MFSKIQMTKKKKYLQNLEAFVLEIRSKSKLLTLHQVIAKTILNIQILTHRTLFS